MPFGQPSWQRMPSAHMQAVQSLAANPEDKPWSLLRSWHIITRC